ncbi:hypothetical protein LTR97_003108 [Elasticomyces elasticus]|uniref:Uncharacterized protein n=1 Tax=Elasticomyces elasticus TaxID=574655 RepID=A0AAN7WNY2_9PEZI|nr:hypothetical protein LTR97_003108 [Elasticomyces elasticus]
MGRTLVQRLLGRGAQGDEIEMQKGHLPVSEPRQVQRIPTLPSREKLEAELEAKCDIQPHTDDGGDAYYIGDAYEQARVAHEWALDDGRPRPYLDFIKRVSKHLPHLEYLAHWMEVTCAPPKWKFIQKCSSNREKRAAKCKVCVLDFEDDKPVNEATFEDVTVLQTALRTPLQAAAQAPIRLIISEDISRDTVELFGSQYDIDPLFFLSHIGDYLFHNTRDRWVELPDLDVVARQRCHFNIQYLRARYFKTDESFKEAERESGSFNVLRRLDSDRSRRQLQDTLLDLKGASVALTRSKTSLWVKPRNGPNEPIVALLLVDPTVQEGHPQWGGYRPFSNTPSMHATEPVEALSHRSLFEDVVHWSSRMSVQEIAAVRSNPRSIGVPILRLVLADWRTVEKYMMTMLGKIGYEFEDPHWAENPRNVDKSMAKLAPWRRNMPYYQQMIAESIDRIFQVIPDLRTRLPSSEPEQPRPTHGLPSLLHDFRLVQQIMADNQQRIEMIQTTASDSINIEESRLAVQQNERAAQQNQNLTRLTFLATIFIPLSFTSSFLSMSPDFKAATQTIWMFFAIGVPLTLFALVTVDLSHPQKSGYLHRGWRKLHEGSTPEQISPIPPPRVPVGQTMPWPTHRSVSGLRLGSKSPT